MQNPLEFSQKKRAERVLLLSIVFLLISTVVLAEDETSQKPEDWDQRLEMLRSVPYIAFSETSIEEGKTGVVLHNPEKVYNGYNFYCTRASGEVFLLDMDGRMAHRWNYSSPSPKASGYDHAILLDNGDLAIIAEHNELLRLNWNSELIWKKELPVHHDLASAPDGSFYVVVREQKIHRGLKVWFPGLVHLTAEGKEIDQWSSYEHLAELKGVLDTRSFLDAALDSALAGRSEEVDKSDKVKETKGLQRHRYGYFHMNSVSVMPHTLLGERDSRFRPGNLLVCFRNIDQIAVLEESTYRVLWAWGEGQLEWPHHPTMLENGHILIFDNGVRRQHSRVVELDPVSGDIVWEYVSKPPGVFYSYTRGSAQRLPNGNALVCESDKGRVFEVTEEGEMVWVWVNPATSGGHPETLYRMMRLPSAQVTQLLER